MYQALYRKWRPKVFSDVIGQSHITDTLRRQVAEGRTSHAYLFTGTRGTGKTTCAKILAKAVNCQQPEDGNPCCRCPSCLGIENGSFLDVLELDAASNNGVDQVRALRDEAVYAPAHVQKRVYIIDEVHMLSLSAFNALLKILEEPPEHLMFILATTELHKVPATILSRCQRFSFKRILPQDVESRLSFVAAQEGIDLTEDGAELLSRLADGALRDGLSLLDQCAASGGTVDGGAVLEVLGLAGNLRTAQLMEHILRRDAQSALELLNQLYAGGKDVGAVLGELAALTRDLLLRKTAPRGAAALLSGGYDAATLRALGEGQSANRLLYLAAALQQTAADLYYSTNRRMDAEICVLRLCDEGLSGDPAALSARMDRLEARLEAMPAAARTPASPPLRTASVKPPAAPDSPPPAPKKTPAAEDAPPWDEPPRPQSPADGPPPPWEDAPASPGAPDPETPPLPEEPPLPGSSPASGEPFPVDPPSGQAPPPPPEIPSPAAPEPPVPAGFWPEVAERCKGRLPPMYRVFLDKCRGALEGDVLTVYVPDELTKTRLDNDRVLTAVREECAALTGAEPQVRLHVGENPGVTPEDRRKSLIAFGSQFDSIQIK